LVLNLPWSIENTFYFEVFFLNSNFHKYVKWGGGCFHPQRSRAGGNELHLGSKFFHHNFYLTNFSENQKLTKHAKGVTFPQGGSFDKLAKIPRIPLKFRCTRLLFDFVKNLYLAKIIAKNVRRFGRGRSAVRRF